MPNHAGSEQRFAGTMPVNQSRGFFGVRNQTADQEVGIQTNEARAIEPKISPSGQEGARPEVLEGERSPPKLFRMRPADDPAGKDQKP